MIKDKEGFKFDLETQRFIINRWETEIGKIVRDRVINGIKESLEIRGILDDYVLDHPENLDPYGHPIYPKSKMKENEFWVLTSDDLRGIRVYNEDFSNSNSLTQKALSYSSFYNCKLPNSDLERTEISYARFEKCNFIKSNFAKSGGFNTQIIKSNLSKSNLYGCGFIDSDFSSTDLSGCYFEDAVFKNIEVDYQTNLDVKLISKWENQQNMEEQKPDILRSFRIAYSDAELWQKMDEFLFEEKLAYRKYILWKKLTKIRSINSFTVWIFSWLKGFISGYATKPLRLLSTSVGISFIYSMIYFCIGIPFTSNSNISFCEYLYFSLTTFATLGYGDLSYSIDYPIMRLISTSEAWLGAIFIALFVVALSRKLFK